MPKPQKAIKLEFDGQYIFNTWGCPPASTDSILIVYLMVILSRRVSDGIKIAKIKILYDVYALFH